jgi:2-polyprenyl-3-methyl-5-hydroxy-6-metoxy-1,4-benzoquinol methylase
MTMTPTTLSVPIAANGLDDSRAVDCCPGCDDPRRTLLYRLTDAGGRIPGHFALYRCAGCGLVYVDPRPGDRVLAELYDEDFYFETGWSYASLADLVIELIQTHRRLRIERYRRDGCLLDIGSGDGHFVHHMARHGWTATGIDFSPSALRFARRLWSGGRFLQGSLEDFDFPPGRFDVITMWQVLEHIGEPGPLLGRCRDLLAPAGMLIAAVPNFDGWSSRLTRDRWWGLDVPRHLVHYTPATLRRSLEESGFRVVRIRHRSLQYDPYALLHSSLDWVFTRRHFLSDFAKRHTPASLPRAEFLYNVAALLVLAPILAPLCVATTVTAACFGHGGFIEVHARRD